jgi:hypothetical protein
MKSPQSWLIGIAVGLLVVLAYLAGRSHVLGGIRSGHVRRRDETDVQQKQGPRQPPPAYNASTAFDELDSLLEVRIDSVSQAASMWNAVMAKGEPGAHALDSLSRTMHALFPHWTGPTAHEPPEVVPWFQQDGVDFSLVRLVLPPSSHIWMVVARPERWAHPGPALLFLHGNDATIEKLVFPIDYHHGAVAELARHGFLTIAPMMPAPTGAMKARLNLRALGSRWTLYNIEEWELEGLLDYMSGLDGVDRSRIAVYGISAGGERALRLGALDSRVGAVIVSGFIADRTEWWYHRQLTPELAANTLPNMPQVLDDRDLMALIYPRFLGIESGERDLRHAAARRKYEEMQLLYQRSGQLDRIAFLPFPGGHETSVATVLPFLDVWMHQASGPQQP